MSFILIYLCYQLEGYFQRFAHPRYQNKTLYHYLFWMLSKNIVNLKELLLVYCRCKLCKIHLSYFNFIWQKLQTCSNISSQFYVRVRVRYIVCCYLCSLVIQAFQCNSGKMWATHWKFFVARYPNHVYTSYVPIYLCTIGNKRNSFRTTTTTTTVFVYLHQPELIV